ncbi:Synaptobrevin,Synaptobrevin/Vesicle-associated membrane protein [Cinara cedri]|uniref:Synaptobrevin,Synaptobrevin/Vesicle-associated membrane protein n=1 Tax=Cinara cedri TaxID=506608 RepID=A0A5E4MX53_9HEMI|nr:Synaptobrevin,Synaptobrevin/Vesicle-associated membrane protein [Cinara cedri]
MADNMRQITKKPTEAQKKLLRESQAKVDEVVGIMKVNVEKVIERDRQISELDVRSSVLQHGASQFQHTATEVKRKMWWKNVRIMIILGIVIAVLLLLILGSFYPSNS